MARGKTRRLLALSAAAIVVLALGVGTFLNWAWQLYQAPGPSTLETTAVLPKGAGLEAIAGILHAAGVIERPWLFVGAAWILGEAGSLKAGEYRFEPRIAPAQVMAALIDGRVYYRRLTVPEGATVADVAALLAAAEGLAQEAAPPGGVSASLPASLPPNLPEGGLLPETYLYSLGDRPADVLARMAAGMQRTLDELWAARAPDLPYASPQEALIMASIIEKETAVPAERARVASVFVNRLRRGMALQSDPTVIYGLRATGAALDRPLTRADLESDTPWNTYRIAGLPPTPIANPGRASLEAALNPESTDYLYFVADGSGGHVFAASLEEHNRNVANWRRHQRNPSHEAKN